MKGSRQKCEPFLFKVFMASISIIHRFEGRSQVEALFRRAGVLSEEYTTSVMHMMDEVAQKVFSGYLGEFWVTLGQNRGQLKSLKFRPVSSPPFALVNKEELQKLREGPFKIAEVSVNCNEVVFELPDFIPTSAPSQFPARLNPTWWDGRAHTVDRRSLAASFLDWVVWIVKVVCCCLKSEAPSRRNTICLREQFATRKSGFRVAPSEISLLVEYCERSTRHSWKKVEEEILCILDGESFDVLAFTLEKREKSSSLRITNHCGKRIYTKTLSM